jgi:ribonuclease HII
MKAGQCLDLEQQYKNEGYRIICGCDEAGRGPLAGPVAAAAVVLPFDIDIDGLDDSKKLSEKKRRQIAEIIQERAVAFSTAVVDTETIEKINILQAAVLAMQKAIDALTAKPDLALIDGNYGKGFSIPVITVTGGDKICASIAAASVLAKVKRDEIMLHYDGLYPEYGFGRHKGYGTKEHYAALHKFGPCPIHRMGFRLA